MRFSRAPTIKAPLPLRLQPVTPRRLGSIPVLSGPSCSRPSMMRPTHQAQAVVAPALWVLPCRSKNQPVPWLLGLVWAAQASFPKLMLPTPDCAAMEEPPTAMMAGPPDAPPPARLCHAHAQGLAVAADLDGNAHAVPRHSRGQGVRRGWKSPSSYCCIILNISAWRHLKSSAVTTGWPL